jgi:transposase
MDNALSKKATDWREGRRLRPWELKQQGWTQQEIADALGVSKGAVSQWMKRGHEGGVEGLKRRIATGAPPRLNEDQRERLAELLASDAEAYGFRGKVWTCRRVAELIFGQFSGSDTIRRTLAAWWGTWDSPCRSHSAERIREMRRP